MEPRSNSSHYAGSWYPAEVAALEALLEGSPESVACSSGPPRPEEILSAAVLPHAGLYYSAPGQAAFWRRWYPLEGRSAPEAVLIISPSHYEYLPQGCILGASFASHETPLGEIPGLLPFFGDRDDPALLAREHGFELLLPGLRFWAGEVPTALILTGPMTSPGEVVATARRLLKRLSRHVNPRRVLWLASSDFTHYGARFGYRFSRDGSSRNMSRERWAREVRDRVARNDQALADAAASGNLLRYWAALREPSSVCGRFAIALVLAVLGELFGQEAVGGRSLCYYTSADRKASSDRDGLEDLSFVSYATLEITRKISRESPS
ncbi:hypothetical protein SAMN05920897_11119 [Alkalispirochaeta americana]|uniref:AmmeMemoRadiSam system protein B n=1 Tax=Alkalispirochaeta americana TaxID=159291 RepID=A0A1N6TW50_9SPIO|nr:AmmeMemoRadiSam system protein B [Alkalispirochaeta americana]SIQ57608.1 hypothetical protein SAMN05920897_11119 [Alkalispirochaeta americana]